MSVGRICTRRVVTVSPEADLLDAARTMRESHVGYLVVVQYKDELPYPIGVLTDRDVVIEVVAREVEPKTLRVRDVMTTELVTLRQGDSIGTALERMRSAGVRRAPVVGSRGELVGLLSIDDAVVALSGELADIAGTIRQGQRIERELRT